MKFTFFIIFFYTLSTLCFGQAAKYSNDFLNIGAGARWLALGGTGVSLSNSVEAGYWNPANLTSMTHRNQISAMHASYFAGMASYNYMTFGHRVDSTSATAFSLIRFGVDDIPNTTELYDSDGNISYDRLSMFSVADYAFLLSYAKKLPINELSVGGNAKIIYRNVGKFAKAFGFGFDAGLKYSYGNWMLGATLKDVTTTFSLWNFNNKELNITIGDSTFNKAPENSLELMLPQLAIGVARSFNLNDELNLSAEIDLIAYFDGKRNMPISSNFASVEPRIGVELEYIKLLYFRLGVNNIQRVSDFDSKSQVVVQPNVGIGLRFRGISLDYALTNAGSVGFSRYSNVFSLTWGFDSISFSDL